jgi:hypothetical protein
MPMLMLTLGTNQSTALLAPLVVLPTPGGKTRVATPALTVFGMKASAPSTHHALSKLPLARPPPLSTSVLLLPTLLTLLTVLTTSSLISMVAML